MRHKLNLDLRSLDRVMMLVHGGYSSGKTHLVGDMLRYEMQHGPVKFLNVKGEDGTLSIASMGLGESGETVETLQDYKDALNDARKANLRALGVDSFKALVKIVTFAKIGDRPPAKDDYTGIHYEMAELATSLRSVAPVVLCVCPSGKSVNQLDGRTYITPDLPGREAAGAAGWFDFLGYLSAETLGADNVKRRVTFAPNTNVITRQRLPKQLTSDITIPNGGGGWEAIYKALQNSLKGDK